MPPQGDGLNGNTVNEATMGVDSAYTALTAVVLGMDPARSQGMHPASLSILDVNCSLLRALCLASDRMLLTLLMSLHISASWGRLAITMSLIDDDALLRLKGLLWRLR